MNQLKLLVAMVALSASTAAVTGLGGCVTTYEKVTRPDGTTIEHWEVEFRPNVLPTLLNYDAHFYGKTAEGLPIQEWVPKHGGENLYEVEGKFYAKKPVVLHPVLTSRESQHETDESEVESFQPREYRISADYFADSAELFMQAGGTDQWQLLVSGDLETVAIAAMRRGLGSMDFENEFGAWSIRVDSPIPFIVTRLNGEIVDVRWVGGALGKPTLDTSMYQRCR